MSLVAAPDQDVEEGYVSTTTGREGVLGAAPQPALAPQPPSFPVEGPPESVTVSIIVENNDNFRGYCPTSVSASLPSSNFPVKNEEDDIYGETTEEEMDGEEEEEERLCAWIYKQSRTAKLLADKVLSSSLPMYPESLP
jgi:hypothetical protein